MPRPRLGLKARFLAACLLLVSISTAGYFVVVAQFVELLERELRDTVLEQELDEFAHNYARDPTAVGPRAAGLSHYVLPPGADDSALPARLRRLPPGVLDDIRLDGREVAVGRQDVDGARLYVVLDMEPIEQMESRFVATAWLCAALSWAAAIALALWLARRVMRPVTELAARVGAWRPDDHQQRLAPEFGDQDVGIIAAAFDRFVARMAEFVGREQAFTEDASHELRTPLAVIDSAAQLLAEDAALSATARSRVQRIQRATEQMTMLMEAVLFLAREDGGLPVEKIALDQLARELADSHRSLIEVKSLTLVITTLPTSITAPRGMVSCVINNLLLNAIHHTKQGRIEVGVAAHGLWVEDTGVGIPPADLARIFERQFRGAQSRGLGLGLYLVKRVCDRLGWTVRVSSAAGAGTRVEVCFRQAVAD